MKKALLLIASAALLFAGCAKEKSMVNATDDGDMVEVTLTTLLENAESGTKASADNDGHAAKVNHWVMEVYDAPGSLFYREEKKKVPAGTLSQTFTFSLFKNQTYTILFWADTKGAYDTAVLTEVSVVGSEANKDSRDAFSAVVEDYTSSSSESKSVTLHRPFGQLNIITTDLSKMKAQLEKDVYEKYAPAELKVKVSIPTTFNVWTQEAGESAETELTADKSYAKFSKGASQTTLFMDYIFAPADEAAPVDVAFGFKSNSNPFSYTFTSVPMRRNYRTNIKGNLMSGDMEWTITIDPEWKTPEYDIEPENE